MNAYSLDFRRAVLMYIDEGHSQKKAAVLFKITPKYVSKWAEIESQREITGSSSAKKSIQIVFRAIERVHRCTPR